MFRTDPKSRKLYCDHNSTFLMLCNIKQENAQVHQIFTCFPFFYEPFGKTCMQTALSSTYTRNRTNKRFTQTFLYTNIFAIGNFMIKDLRLCTFSTISVNRIDIIRDADSYMKCYVDYWLLHNSFLVQTIVFIWNIIWKTWNYKIFH